MITKDKIVDDFHSLLTTEPQQSRFYYNKSVSFRYELEFSKICKKQKINTLDGGMFLFRKSPDFYFIYVTISADKKENYSSFYDKLGGINKKNLRHLFFGEIDGWDTDETTIKTNTGPEVKLDISNPQKCPPIEPIPKQKKQNTQILTPKINFYEYDGVNWNPVTSDDIRKHFDTSRRAVYSRKQSFIEYMKQYSMESLADFYSNRFFFDVTLAGISKGMSDIDKIIIDNENYILVEVKNKTPTNNQFGWDFRRIAWYLFLKEKTGIDIQYVVAHIDNRENRDIVAWKDITIDHWCKCADWGGDKLGNQMAAYDEFSDNYNSIT